MKHYLKEMEKEKKKSKVMYILTKSYKSRC